MQKEAREQAKASRATAKAVQDTVRATAKASDDKLAQAMRSSEDRLSKLIQRAAKASDDKLAQTARASEDRLTRAARASSDTLAKAVAANAKAVEVNTRAIANLERAVARVERSAARMERVMDRVTRLEEKHIGITERVNHRAMAQLEKSDVLLGFEKEAVWAQVFNNAIAGSEWATGMSLWPGRFSVGYAYLFVLYRALTTLRPKRILDIGLGITTRFFEGYTRAEPEVRYTVVENNAEWIAFFANNEPFPPQAEVLHLPAVSTPYQEDENVLMYQGFAGALQGRQFDLLSIDGPFGGKEMGEDRARSRVDILSILPDCLAPSFVMLIDDYHRIGEQRTVADIEALLAARGIETRGKAYAGTKKFYVLVSPDNEFLLTL